jgi:hypothetical protein
MPRRVHHLLVAGLGLVAAACARSARAPRSSAEMAAGPPSCEYSRLLTDTAVYTTFQWQLERAMADTALQERLNRAVADTALQERLNRAVADTAVQARIAQFSSHLISCAPGRR